MHSIIGTPSAYMTCRTGSHIITQFVTAFTPWLAGKWLSYLYSMWMHYSAG